MATEHRLECECGAVVTAGDLDGLVTAARRHADREHGMHLSVDQARRLAGAAGTGPAGDRNSDDGD